MEEDPLESMTKECQITSSQEMKLKKCRFALESEEEDEEEMSPPCSVQVTGIMMVSPPESYDECLEDDVFHTPPEHDRSQSMSSSEDQGPVQPQFVMETDIRGCDAEAEKTVDLGKDSVTLGFSELNEIDGVKDVVFDTDVSKIDTGKTVDLGKDSDTVVFSEPIFVKENGVDCVKDAACDSDLSKTNAERTVDLGKDSDTLVFSEPNIIKEKDGVKDVVCDPDLSKVERDLKRCKVLESECGQSVFDESNVSAENMQFTEPIVIESENVEIGEAEVVDLAFEESCKEMGARVSENTKNVDERGGKKGIPVRRELPNSFKEPEENEGLWVPRQSLDDNKAFKDLLEAARTFIDDSSTDTDFLKATKERGLSFYRPRWWPPEGSDDQIVDNI